MKPSAWFPVMMAATLAVSCDRANHPGTADDGSGAANGNSGRRTSEPRTAHRPDSQVSDLRKTLRDASGIPEPEKRARAIAEVAWNAVELDPALFREALDALPAGDGERLRLIQHQATRMAEENPESALAWAAGLGSDSEIAAARCRIALVLADAEPHRAAEILSEFGIEGRDFDVVAVQVIQRWSQRSPKDAAAWVVMFPEGQSRDAGVRVVVDHWLEADPSSAFAWLGSLVDDSLRKESALAMAEALLRQPENVRNEWLEKCPASIREEIDRETEKARGNVGADTGP